MNKAKTILYATLIGLAGLATSPKEAYAQDKDQDKVFYYSSREDKNGDGIFQTDEYFGVQKYQGPFKPLKVNAGEPLYLRIEKRSSKLNIKKEDGKMMHLEDLAESKNESIFKMPEEKGSYSFILTKGNHGMIGGKLERE